MQITRSVHATEDEQARSVPGDELIREPLGSLTHAITIQRAPRDVWPWLAQMGAGNRAGWYSYDFIDNDHQPSADRIVPELQHLAVGMIFPALPGARDGFRVVSYEPDRSLVIGWPSQSRVWLTTWAFLLERLDNGFTRLVVRARGGRGYQFHGLPWWLAKRIIPIVHFIMQRKQLLGIAERAERNSPR